jgi:nitroreductase
VAGAGASPAIGGPGPLDAARLEEAVVAAAAGDDRVLLAAVTSEAATRRLRAAWPPDGWPEAPAAVVACVGSGGTDDAGTSLAGAAIGRLVVALRAVGLAWRWDPGEPIDAAPIAAALALDHRWRPAGVVAVGTPGGGA